MRAFQYYLTGTLVPAGPSLPTPDLGIEYFYKAKEHVLPPHMNVRWIKKQPIGFGGRAVRKFLLLYREKLYSEKRKGKNRSRNHVMMVLRSNPNSCVDLLKNKYPDIDVDKLLKSDKVRGHYMGLSQ